MSSSKTVSQKGPSFEAVLAAAAKLPGVRINRASYLRKALSRHCSVEQVELAIAETPAFAGIPLDVLSNAANDSIRLEATRVTALAAAAGVPGGLALIGTIPADMAQTLAHVLRIAQKIAYLYSWPDLFDDDGDELDDSTANMLTLFVGVMIGTQAANEGVTKAASMVAQQMLRTLPQKALTKGVIYPIVQAVAKQLGIQMSKQIFAKGVAKVIPVVGAVLNGGLTLATFVPMSTRLKKHLAASELARPRA